MSLGIHFREQITKRGWLWCTSLVSTFVIAVFLVFLTNEAWSFPEHELVRIPEGVTSRQATALLEEHGVVASSKAIDLALFLRGGADEVKAGDYFFETPEGPWRIAERLMASDYGLTPQRIVVPEGVTVREMAIVFERSLDGLFDPEIFIQNAEEKEGYLFPDTYFFLPNATADVVIRVLERNFNTKIAEISDEIAAFGKPFNEVVVMASLLEKEARRLETRRMIAGILWKRIEIGMPLQVDAVFPYIIGKNTFEVTLEDLEFDSPYNTYKYRGLPPGAIANPGLDSLRAAVTPIQSEYLYYLADSEGETHYAETFEEHVTNKRLYLR